jgi:3-oxoacyl-[acyl-carrier protein] reductase
VSEPQTALVTGAARGIGREVAKQFLERGARVIALDREFGGSELPDSPAVQRVRYDLTDLPGIPRLVGSLGRIDVLVNNAGLLNGKSWEDYAAEPRERILAVNLEAPVELIRAVAPQMVKRGSGRIVNLASIGAYTAHPDVWYGVTKAGMVSLTKSFASYLGRHGIQVNAVSPGPIETELLLEMGAHAPERMAWLKRTAFSGRLGQPREVAEVIYWLGTSSPAYVNGTVIDVMDGCYTR